MKINRDEVLKLASEFDVGQSDTLETFLCALLKINSDDLYKELFDRLPAEEKETKLMEAAMRIQEIFDEMLFKKEIDEEKVYGRDSMSIGSLFCEWAREFEYQHFDTDDFIGESDQFAQRKIKEEFG